MNDITPRKIKTGGDPRTLPDYAALRDELRKLNHPARPDVNWINIEKLCLSLFEQNGVDLQTAAWYTLARAHLSGLVGLNEGLTILEALIRHQWEMLWPQPVPARMEILSSLSQRLQQLMRALPLNDNDLSQIWQAGQRLASLGAAFQRRELQHLNRLDTLRILMHNSAVRLEKSVETIDSDAAVQPAIELSAIEMSTEISSDDPVDIPVAEKVEPIKRGDVAQPEHQPKVEVLAAMPVPVKKWTFFAAGMCTMLMISIVAVWIWHYFHQADPLQAQLAASVSPLPATLTPAQLELARQQSLSPQSFIEETEQQLIRLGQLPPDWNIAYSLQPTACRAGSGAVAGAGRIPDTSVAATD